MDDDRLPERFDGFDRDGYLVVRDVLAQATVKHVHDYLADQAGLLLLGEISPAEMAGHYPLDVRLSETLWAIPASPGLQNILRVLLRSNDLFMHMPPMARFVLPGNDQAAVPAHQDAIYNEHMQGFITVWVPLVTIDDQCGGVTLYGGHRSPVLKAEAHPGRFWKDAVDTSGLAPAAPHFEPGDILVMDNHVIHASAPNLSDHPRISMDLRFFGSDGYSSKHYLDMQTWTVVAP